MLRKLAYPIVLTCAISYPSYAAQDEGNVSGAKLSMGRNFEQKTLLVASQQNETSVHQPQRAALKDEKSPSLDCKDRRAKCEQWFVSSVITGQPAKIRGIKLLSDVGTSIAKVANHAQLPVNVEESVPLSDVKNQISATTESVHNAGGNANLIGQAVTLHQGLDTSGQASPGTSVVEQFLPSSVNNIVGSAALSPIEVKLTLDRRLINSSGQSTVNISITLN